ncbi:anti-sigma-I factor RsgI family protein [Pseudobacteroides cellulosolvens]|uniref:Type 3a cellulose-binding domain protein n=1 Tax=Pseudobacteroides cellulosolvens ATCC 35603 = DSM 2933 TaxID=398512 RepID=A0A0L6JWX6_9FIRM|nr:cellulose binding domain-containing protein [Pseudobacteroides cellulosolvens]KNY30356.1 type 3a cellulose-binding domain protein [Pseudobacteroides cellulosolvens ATCC 35603 = DSM 2933]
MKHSGTIEYGMENSIDSAHDNNYDIGIVYEMSDSEAVVLDSNGRFIFIRRKSHMEIGHTVKFRYSDVLLHRNKKQKLLPFLSAAAAVLIAALVLFKVYSPFGTPIYGYIDIDVNPSTEFEFDKNLNVVNVVALNNDSAEVTDDIDLYGKPVNQALEEYIEKLISIGVIDKKSENFVLLSAALYDADDKAAVNSLLSNSKKKVDLIAKSQKLKIRSEALSLASSHKKASSKNNVSMGKYYLYLKARENGSQLDESSLTDTPVFHLAELSGLFKTDKKGSSSVTPNTNSKSTNTSQPSGKAAASKPVATNTSITTPAIQALSPTSKQTLNLYTNTPAAKITQTQSSNTPAPSKVKASDSFPTPSGTTGKNNSEKNGSNSLKLEFYNRDKLKRTQGISLDFKITNTGSDTIDLKDVKIRYYFTKEGDSKPIYSSYFFSHGEKTDVHGKFASHSLASGTDHYVEIYFDNGTLLPNKEVYAFGSITKEDWGYFEQDNDYSFDAEAKDFTVQDKITAYISDALVWGKEPN